MTDPVAFGIPGLELTPGDHVCAFYRSLPERDGILVPYLREGLRAGDKCICVVDATEPDALLAALGADVDLGSGPHGQLEVQGSTDAYLGNGGFSTTAMLGFWDRVIGGALASGGEFDFARSAGEMTWALREVPGVEELVRYESELNRFLPRYPQVILCLYDLERFGGEVLVDILKTHPKLLLGGTLIENPYYLAPDEFFATRR